MRTSIRSFECRCQSGVDCDAATSSERQRQHSSDDDYDSRGTCLNDLQSFTVQENLLYLGIDSICLSVLAAIELFGPEIRRAI